MRIEQLIDEMPRRYRAGRIAKTTVFYFSIGSYKATVTATPEELTIERDKKVDNADVVLKTTPELFEKMVLKGKMPGTIDIARGKVKSNNPVALKAFRDYFDFSGL